MSPTEAALQAEFESIDADLEWRRLRALRFVELVSVDGQVHQVAFKELDLDSKVIDLERQARRLAAEARAAWIEAQHTPTTEEVQE